MNPWNRFYRPFGVEVRGLTEAVPKSRVDLDVEIRAVMPESLAYAK